MLCLSFNFDLCWFGVGNFKMLKIQKSQDDDSAGRWLLGFDLCWEVGNLGLGPGGDGACSLS